MGGAGRRGPRDLPIEGEGRDLMAGVAVLDAATHEILGTLEFLNGHEVCRSYKSTARSQRSATGI